MIRIGEYNKLLVKKERDFGYYLGEDLDPNNKEEILIPFPNIPSKELKVEEEVEVFVYKDSKDRLIATLKKPFATVGEVAYLKVVDKTEIGHFIDFGLERDVLVPFKELAYDLEVGEKYLFYLYLDKSDRITATTYVDKYLHTTNHFNVGEEVMATAYGEQENGTVMVAIQNLYMGVILKKENFSKIRPGEILNVRVKRYYEDGKMEVTPRKKRMEEASDLETGIMCYLRSHNNHMKFNDASSPEQIKSVFKCSKNAFKRALGGLMKKGMITQDEQGTTLVNEKPIRQVKSKKNNNFKSKNNKLSKSEYKKEYRELKKELIQAEKKKEEQKNKFYGKFMK